MNTKALSDVVAERQRQQEQEGYSQEHDDEHNDGVLARAAASYAAGGGLFKVVNNTPLQVWPYQWDYKPKGERQRLVVAAALLLAEIERIDRLPLK
jgi:hypothetical protein